MMRKDPYKMAAAARAEKMERVVFNIAVDRMDRFDQWAVAQGYDSRAEALRYLVDAALSGEIKERMP